MIEYTLTAAEEASKEFLGYTKKWNEIIYTPISKPTKKRVEELRVIATEALIDIYAYLRINNPTLNISPKILILPSIYHLITGYNFFEAKEIGETSESVLEKRVSTKLKEIAPSTFDMVLNLPNQKSPVVFSRGKLECFVLLDWYLDHKKDLVKKLTPVELKFLQALLVLLRHFPNWAPTEEAEILTLPPIKMEILNEVNNQQSREFHCLTGPAATFSDGYKIYALRNIQVPSRFITDTENLTAEDVAGISNGEIRRLVQEKMGYKNYLLKVGAKLIDTDTIPINKYDPKSKVILRALMMEPSGSQWLICNDGSTNRVYYIPVVNTVTTCVAAHESTIRHLGIKDSDIALNA